MDEAVHPYDSDSAEAVSNVKENVILEEKDKEYEGDDNFYQEFNDMFEIPSVIPDSQSDINPRRHSRKTSFPKKLSDFKIDTKLPVGRKPIGSKWVFKVKYKSTGEVEWFKARLVAKGFNQRDGIDYEETFSLFVKIVSVRCILLIDVYHNWPIFQLDINNAFLYDDLVEDVYMSLWNGYLRKGGKTKPKRQNRTQNGKA
ncbi:ribonuclease H-like domain-containing protein [Tanacetum coccineum]